MWGRGAAVYSATTASSCATCNALDWPQKTKTTLKMKNEIKHRDNVAWKQKQARLLPDAAADPHGSIWRENL
jgi:hypothetical protein